MFLTLRISLSAWFATGAALSASSHPSAIDESRKVELPIDAPAGIVYGYHPTQAHGGTHPLPHWMRPPKLKYTRETPRTEVDAPQVSRALIRREVGTGHQHRSAADHERTSGRGLDHVGQRTGAKAQEEEDGRSLLNRRNVARTNEDLYEDEMLEDLLEDEENEEGSSFAQNGESWSFRRRGPRRRRWGLIKKVGKFFHKGVKTVGGWIGKGTAAITKPVLGAIGRGFKHVVKGLIPKKIAMNSLTDKTLKMGALKLPAVPIAHMNISKVQGNETVITALKLGEYGKKQVAINGLQARGFEINGLSAEKAKITNADVSGLKLKDMHINGLQANKLKMKGVKVEGKASLDGAKLHRLNLEGQLVLDPVVLNNVDIAGKADLQAQLHGVDMSGAANFAGMDLGQISIDDVEFGPFKSVVNALAYYALMCTVGLTILGCMTCFVLVFAGNAMMNDIKKAKAEGVESLATKGDEMKW